MIKIVLILLLVVQIDKYPVEVKWIDITTAGVEWHNQEYIDNWIETEPDTVTQVGYVYRRTDKYLILADSYITEDNIGTITKIPMGCIISIRELK